MSGRAVQTQDDTLCNGILLHEKCPNCFDNTNNPNVLQQTQSGFYPLLLWVSQPSRYIGSCGTLPLTPQKANSASS